MENVISLLDAMLTTLGICSLVSGAIIVVYHKVYNKGKKEAIDSSCAKRIENNIKDIGTAITSHVTSDEKEFKLINERFEREDEKADKQHSLIYDKINDQNADISEIKGMVTMIRDRLNNSG